MSCVALSDTLLTPHIVGVQIIQFRSKEIDNWWLTTFAVDINNGNTDTDFKIISRIFNTINCHVFHRHRLTLTGHFMSKSEMIDNIIALEGTIIVPISLGYSCISCEFLSSDDFLCSRTHSFGNASHRWGLQSRWSRWTDKASTTYRYHLSNLGISCWKTL